MSLKRNKLYFFIFTIFCLSVYGQTKQENLKQNTEPKIIPPVLIKFIQATYSKKDLKNHIEGSITFELLVNEKGLVDSIQIVKGLKPSLDSATKRAVSQFKFNPATIGLDSIPVIIEYRYDIKMTDVEIPEYINFKGQVRAKGTRSPLINAILTVSFSDTSLNYTPIPFSKYLKKIGSFKDQKVENSTVITKTDSLGNFQFKSLPSGSFKVSILASGYKLESFKEILKEKQQVENLYRLNKEVYDDYEVIVYGKSKRKQVSKSELSVGEIKRLPGFGGDAIRVVEALPSTSRSGFLSGNIIVRGGSSQDTRFLLNNLDIPQVFHFGGLRSVIHSSLIQSFTLYPGGFNARYGGAISGILYLKTRPAKTDRWHGELNISWIDANILLEGPINKKHSFIVSGRYSYLGLIVQKAIKSLADGTTIFPAYADALIRWDYKISKKNHFYLSYNGSLDTLSLVLGASTDTTNRNQVNSFVNFNSIYSGLKTKINPKIENDLNFSFSSRNNSTNAFDLFDFNLNIKSFSLKNELSWTFNPKINTYAGLDLNIAQVKNDITIDFDQASFQGRDIQTTYYSNIAGYLIYEYQPTKEWLITPSVRYDYYNEIQDAEVSIRLTSRYQYTKSTTIKAAIGTYNQSPKPLGQSISPTFGNPDLSPTLAQHYILGHEWQISNLIFLDVQTYFNYQTQIPVNTDSLRSNGQRFNFLPDMEGRAYGFEILLKHDRGQSFFGWISYSLSRSERKAPRATNQGFLTNQKQGLGNQNFDPKKWVLFQSDQPHNFQIIGNWRLPRNWEVGFRFRYFSGNPTTPLINSTEQLFDSDAFAYLENQDDAFSNRIDPFVQLDLRADKKFIFNNLIWSIYLDIQNASFFWYESPETVDYNYDFTEQINTTIPIIPTLGISLKF